VPRFGSEVDEVSHSGQSLARGRLRLASAPGALAARRSRALLRLQALLAAVLLWLIGAILRIAAAVALLPVLRRRAPLGRRLRPAHLEARIIPFHPAQRSAQRSIPR
jgi:hypothetical protein